MTGTRRRFLGAGLCFLVILFPASAQTVSSASRDWTTLQNVFDSQAWNAAAKLALEFVQNHPDSPRADAASFLRGVALLRAQRSLEALDTFQKLQRSVSDPDIRNRIPYWEGWAAYASEQWALAETEFHEATHSPSEPSLFSKAWFYLGIVRQKLNQVEPARSAFEAFLATRPADPELKAQALLRLGDLCGNDSARTFWLKVLTEIPDSPLVADAALRLSQLEKAQGRDEAGVAVLKQALELQPQLGLRLLPAMADLQQGLGDWPAVERTLERYLELETDPVLRQKTQADLAFALEKSHKDSAPAWKACSRGPDLALAARAILEWAAFQEKSKRFETGASGLYGWGKPLDADPEAEAPLWSAVRLYRLAGNLEGARHTVDLLLAHFPHSSNLPLYLLESARLEHALGDNTAALKICQNLTDHFSQSSEAGEARYLQGMIYMTRGEPLRAEGYFYTLMENLGNGLEKTELYQRALLARGLAFLGGGKPDLAEDSLRRLLNEAPQGPWAGEAWTALGATLAGERHFRKAAEAYTQSLLHLTDPAEREKAEWSRAQVLSTAGDWSQAAESYETYTKDFPDSKNVLKARFYQGVCLARQSQWDAALAVWTPQISKRDPELPITWWQESALAELNTRRSYQAWKILTEMGEVYKKNKEAVAEVLVRWALAAENLGKPREAQRAYTRVVADYPQTKASQIALPKAAGALVASGGDPQAALERYAEYFKVWGKSPQAVGVVSAACSQMSHGAQDFFRAFYKASQSWPLSSEVRSQIDLEWWKSQIDVDSKNALQALSELARSAPWPSQRSEALRIAGRWATRQGKWDQARDFLTAALTLGDDLSIFEARAALADLSEAEGKLENAARLRETAERQSGEGVPTAFKIELLRKAEENWKTLGKSADLQRVRARLKELEEQQAPVVFDNP
ncbi:MAG: tetratricopeptide repeat protein [Spirochaetales bacterium]|nr:tetratricopeptide repeat protein [Spirochaetales bacterium]